MLAKGPCRISPFCKNKPTMVRIIMPAHPTPLAGPSKHEKLPEQPFIISFAGLTLRVEWGSCSIQVCIVIWGALVNWTMGYSSF